MQLVFANSFLVSFFFFFAKSKEMKFMWVHLSKTLELRRQFQRAFHLAAANHLQYCAKVMRAKCANFVLCPCQLSTKFRSKIREPFRDVSGVILLMQREKIRRIFEASPKIQLSIAYILVLCFARKFVGKFRKSDFRRKIRAERAQKFASTTAIGIAKIRRILGELSLLGIEKVIKTIFNYLTILN